MNNKTNIITKTLIAGLACVAFCGVTLAAPHGGGNAPQKAPTHQTDPVRNGGHAPNGGHTPANHVTHRAPAPRHREPPPPPPSEHHHGGHDCRTGWLTLGAAAIGGVIGGIIETCN